MAKLPDDIIWPTAQSGPPDDVIWPTKTPAQKSTSESVADMMVRFATGGAGLAHGVEKAGKHAKGLMTGEISPTPGEVLPWATLGMGASPVRIGLGGKPLPPRTAAELEEAATSAVTRPTGEVVPQAEAGAAVRQAVRQPPPAPPVDDWIAASGPAKPGAPAIDDWMKTAGGPIEDWMKVRAPGEDWIARLPRGEPSRSTGPWGPAGPAAEEAPLTLSRVISSGRLADEHIVANLVGAAEKPGGHVSVAQLRRATPIEEWPKVQGASLGYLGRTGGVGEPVGWDAITMLQRYKALPEPSKGVLYGQPVTVAGQKLQAGLRPHLDSLVADMERIEKVRAALPPAAQATAPIPIRALGEVLGAGSYTLFRAIGMPRTAASVAHWSRALARVIEKGKTPGAIGALVVATKGLESTLGEKIDLDKLISVLNPIGSAQASPRKGIADINKPLPEEEEARRRINERGGAPVRADGSRETGLKVIKGVTDFLTERDWDLPFEKMRQSKNVQIPDRPSDRPVDPRTLADLYSKFWAGAERPFDELAVQAGAYDLGNRFRRR